MACSVIEKEIQAYGEVVEEAWKARYDEVEALCKLKSECERVVRFGNLAFDETIQFGDQIGEAEAAEFLPFVFRQLHRWDEITLQVLQIAERLKAEGLPIEGAIEGPFVERLARAKRILTGDEDYPRHLHFGQELDQETLGRLARCRDETKE